MSKPDIQRLPTRPRRQRPAARRDRGMALVFVLIMISIVFVIAAVSARLVIQGERTARKVLAQLLADGLLISDTPKGPVRMGLPLDALGILLPNLYPEAVSSVLDY